MRGAAVITLALALALPVVPATAQQQRDAKPTTTREKDQSHADARSVTGKVKRTMDDGLVVVGREKGKKDREWAFVVEAGTRIDGAQGASGLKEGDPVTVRYTDRDGKMVAEHVTVTKR